jgi:hypothetical protein
LISVFWLIETGWIISLSLAAAGLLVSSRDPTIRLLLLNAAVFTVLVAAMVAATRFRIPFGFLVAVLAGVGADRLISRSVRWRDLVPVSVVVALLLFSFSQPIFRAIGTGAFSRPFELHKLEPR